MGFRIAPALQQQNPLHYPPALPHAAHDGKAVIKRKLSGEGVGVDGSSDGRQQQRRARQAAAAGLPLPLLLQIGRVGC